MRAELSQLQSRTRELEAERVTSITDLAAKREECATLARQVEKLSEQLEGAVAQLAAKTQELVGSQVHYMAHVPCTANNPSVGHNANPYPLATPLFVLVR